MFTFQKLKSDCKNQIDKSNRYDFVVSIYININVQNNDNAESCR